MFGHLEGRGREDFGARRYEGKWRNISKKLKE